MVLSLTRGPLNIDPQHTIFLISGPAKKVPLILGENTNWTGCPSSLTMVLAFKSSLQGFQAPPGANVRYDYIYIYTYICIYIYMYIHIYLVYEWP